MPSKRTLNSNSPLDTPEARKVLASIKRDLRRVERDVQALRWLQARIAEGLTISAALALLRASLRASRPPVTPIGRAHIALAAPR